MATLAHAHPGICRIIAERPVYPNPLMINPEKLAAMTVADCWQKNIMPMIQALISVIPSMNCSRLKVVSLALTCSLFNRSTARAFCRSLNQRHVSGRSGITSNSKIPSINVKPPKRRKMNRQGAMLVLAWPMAKNIARNGIGAMVFPRLRKAKRRGCSRGTQKRLMIAVKPGRRALSNRPSKKRQAARELKSLTPLDEFRHRLW